MNNLLHTLTPILIASCVFTGSAIADTQSCRTNDRSIVGNLYGGHQMVMSTLSEAEVSRLSEGRPITINVSNSFLPRDIQHLFFVKGAPSVIKETNSWGTFNLYIIQLTDKKGKIVTVGCRPFEAEHYGGPAPKNLPLK